MVRAGRSWWETLPPALRADLRILLVSHAAATVGRGVFFTLTAVYFTLYVGLDVRLLGLALTIAGGVGVVAAYIAGRIADRVDTRKVLIVATITEGVALVGVTYSSDFWTLALFSSLTFAFDRAGMTARQTMIAVRCTGAERISARARLRVATNVGIGLGSLLAAGVLTSSTVSVYQASLTTAAAIYLVAGGIQTRLSRDGDVQDAGSATRLAHGPWKDRNYILLTLAYAATSTHYAIIETALPVWIVTRTNAPDVAVSVLLVTNTVLVIGLQLPLAKGLERPLIAGRMLLTAGVLIVLALTLYAGTAQLAVTAAVSVLIAGMTAHSVAEVLLSNSMQHLGFERAQPGRQGAYQGVFTSGQALGLAVGPGLAAVAVTAGNSGWVLLGCLYVAACALAWGISRLPTRDPSVAAVVPARPTRETSR